MRVYPYVIGAFLLGALMGGCALNIAPPPSPAATELPSATPAPTASPTPTSTLTPIPTDTATPPPTRTPEPVRIHLVAVGDVMLGRQVYIGMIQRKDYTWPFQETVDVLRPADLTLGNLENPIVSYCKPSDGGDVLCTGPRSIEGLTWAGFDVMTLANNHSRDYGGDAFDGTAKYLEDVHITPVYMGHPAIVEIRGVRVGIVGFDDSETALDMDKALEEVQALRGQVDILIAMLHWGYEYHPTESVRQTKVGHTFIDAGVDLILGSHPHWRQPVEEYNGKLIFYSLGNFVFDQMWSEEVRKGNVADITLIKDETGLTMTYELIPISIFYFGQPTLDNK